MENTFYIVVRSDKGNFEFSLKKNQFGYVKKDEWDRLSQNPQNHQQTINVYLDRSDLQLSILCIIEDISLPKNPINFF